MKYAGLLLLAFLVSASGAFAQLVVEITPEQDQFLPGEAIPLAVRVTNRSGQSLHLGKDDDWLTFAVEAKEGFIVLKTGEVPVVQEFDLASSQVATKHVDLAPYFNLSRIGRYKITALVRIRDWNLEVSSDPQNIDIVRGVNLWEREFGVPPALPGGHDQPEMRKYTLQKAVMQNNMKLYLRLTDSPETQVFKVFPIGPMISFSRLDPQLDPQSNLHLLYQTGSHSLFYNVINPQGEVICRQTYDYTDTRPRLKMNDSGKVSVVGGIRHLAENDIPPSSELPLVDKGKAAPKSPKP